MTAHQQIALMFIRSRLLIGMVAPSLQEIADHLGFRGGCPRAQAKRVVDALVSAGDLVRTGHKVRGLALPRAAGGGLCERCGAEIAADGRGAFHLTEAGRAFLAEAGTADA